MRFVIYTHKIIIVVVGNKLKRLIMDPVEMFEYMATCMKKWNYPGIHGMDQAQIAEIFSAPNRSFLVTWLLKRLYPEQFQTNDTYDTHMLADFLYSVGFCSKKQKANIFSTKFFEHQVKVLYKMFLFSNELSEPIVSNVDRVTIADIEELNNQDLNLFPCYGPITVLPEEKRKNLKERLDKDVELLESKLLRKDIVISVNSLEYDKEFDTILKELETCIPEVKSVAYDVISSPEVVANENIVINSDMSDTIENAAKSLKKISQYLADIKTVTDFEKHDVKFKDNLEDMEGPDLIKSLVSISEDVLHTANELSSKLKIDQ